MHSAACAVGSDLLRVVMWVREKAVVGSIVSELL